MRNIYNKFHEGNLEINKSSNNNSNNSNNLNYLRIRRSNSDVFKKNKKFISKENSLNKLDKQNLTQLNTLPNFVYKLKAKRNNTNLPKHKLGNYI